MEYNKNKFVHYWQTNWTKTKKNINQYKIPFSIMMPPPNVNGILHIGHSFEYTIIDTIIRYKWMQGYKTLFQFGTDHAGIATQLLMEKLHKNIKSYYGSLKHTFFLNQTLKWCNNTIPKIILQIKKLGVCVDWENERFTMDYGFNQSVQDAFIDFYKEGLIYRGKRLINWDPKLGTALSDIEVESIKSKGSIWYIRYPIVDYKTVCKCIKKKYVIIATTRPETIFADTCLAVNPYDYRYKHLIGRCVIVPILCRIIPIISDDFVDKTFGTGCVKITPAHNFIDYKLGKKTNSLLINIFTKDFKVRKKAEICTFKEDKIISYTFFYIPKQYVGNSINILRKHIVKELLDKNLLEKKINNYILILPCGDRSGSVLEPLLTDQWFVSIKTLSTLAITAVKNSNIQFIPKNYKKIYINWMYNLKDWCVSRQLWWGHRIPAWFDNYNNIFVGRNEEEIRTKYCIKKFKLHQDHDVLDTWFSSGLWTFSTIGWPQYNKQLVDSFHPSSVLITGFDIIPFWVSRLIMMTLKFINEIPFKQIFIHGLIRDKNGKKMSKSKGNVIDPIKLISGINYGSDALRYALLSFSLPGKDIKFDLGRLKGYIHFCNKLCNATKYVIYKAEKFFNKDYKQYFYWNNLSSINKFIISLLQKTKKTFINYLDKYRFDLASQYIYEFIWYEFCDWYLEFSKIIFNSKNILLKFSTINTLLYVLKELLLLLHPLIPFITEYLWKNIMLVQYNNKKTIVFNQSWPKIEINKIDENSIYDVFFIKKIITIIRYIRLTMHINKFYIIKVFFSKVKLFYKTLLKTYNNYICNLANIKIIKYFEPIFPCLSKNIKTIMIMHIPFLTLSDHNFINSFLKKQKTLIKSLKHNTVTSKILITTNKIKLKKINYLLNIIKN